MKTKLLFFIVFTVLFSVNVLATPGSYYFNTSKTNNTIITSNEIVSSSSVLLQIITDKPTTCKYSNSQGIPYLAMQGVFDFNFETIHKKILTDLSDGIYKYYIKCQDNSDNKISELEAIFAVNIPVSAQILLPKGSPIKAGRFEVKLITSKIVSQTPSLSYSFDGISYNPIPLFGSGTTWTGYLIIPNSLNEKVGTFKFQGRNLEGNLGTKITSGGIFLVDTLKPETITDIKAESSEGMIKLVWYFNSVDNVNKFNIYRSTSSGLNQADYYKTVDKPTFSDTSVEKGKTYYYKVSAVDEANNEGDLSPEVYATALLKNVTVSPSGLETRFLGIVDNSISEINSVAESGKIAKQNFESNVGEGKILYSNLKLGREIDSAEAELNSLKKEINSFKTQSLTKNELDKKLNSGELKLSIIKKKIPENIIVISKKTYSGDANENDIKSLILELTPGISESTAEKSLKKSLASAIKNNFNVKREGYNLKIVYLDGTSKETSLIKEEISSSKIQNNNISILEVIPKSVVDNVVNVNIKNIDYKVLKEDPIISFSADTEEIIYTMDKQIDLNSIKEIKTILLDKFVEKPKVPIFTGYFSFINLNSSGGGNYFGIFIGILIALALSIYFFLVKRKRNMSEKLFPSKEKIFQAEKRINEGKLERAREIYTALSEEYKKFGKKEKELIYDDLKNIHKKINEFSKK